MSNNLLPAKLIIPHTRPEVVVRPRLLTRLHQGFHRKLTLVSAPAGFGKTTLIAEWVDEFKGGKGKRAEVQIAWLSLDEADNDFNRFLTYFIAALGQNECLDPESEEAILKMIQSQNPPPIETLLSPLLTTLSDCENKLILVIDDYHLIENLSIHQSLNFWLDQSPANIHTVIITREDPPFPLARLRAGNQMTELRVAELRFTGPESNQFLNEIMNLHLDAGSVTVLKERTEGWIAGLQMVGLSLKDRKDVGKFIEQFSGTNRYILDYLLEEVLLNQPQEVQDFLLQTSILRQLSGSLCDAVLKREKASTSTLAYLEQANLFLIPLDDDRKWYRYHHLFADLLRAHLHLSHTESEISNLHQRAATWYEKEGMSFGAIYHASLIPDDEWVERIIDQNYMEIFQRRDSALIQNWTGELGKELLFKRPQLAIHEANSRAWFGQLDEADHLLNEAQKGLDADEQGPESLAMQGYLAYVRSRVTAMRGDFTKAIQLCILAEENTPESNQGLLGGIGVMLGYGYFLNGEFSKARKTLEVTIQTGKKAGAINTTIGAYCVLARLHAIQGQLHRSFDLYKDGERFIQHSPGEHLGAMSIINVGFAEILYEWNELEASLSHLQKGLKHLALWSKADDFALAYILQAKLHKVQGDDQAAEISINRGVQIINFSGVFSEARDAVRVEEIRMMLQKGDLLEANHRIKSTDPRSTSDNPYNFNNELILLTIARVLSSQQNYDESLEILGQLESNAQGEGRNGRVIQNLVLQSIILQEKGEPNKAFLILERALSLAEPERFGRTFIDEGQPILSLLKDWLANSEPGSITQYAKHLVSQYSTQSKTENGQIEDSSIREKMFDDLTKREIEVLNLISQGKTNKEISTELIVSPGTVKAHTSNIYRKLDVSNRTEAVSHARELGILP